jgi:hypothetical protein
MNIITQELTNSNFSVGAVYGFKFLNVSVTNNSNYYGSKNCGLSMDTYFGLNIFTAATAITKTFYNLPPHQWIRITIQLITTNLWDGTIYLVIDQTVN